MIDINNHFCPNPKCKDFGIRNSGNIGTRGTYGKAKRYMLYCRTCNTRFSETRCTAFFGTKYSDQTIQLIIRTVAEGNGVRATARILGLSKDAVNRIILVAGNHCEKVLSNLLKDLMLTEVQLDELWSFVKKTKFHRG